ncbi:4676_t:CDS:2 [Rhizophagus irregularis]|nr:4676_t:CDS:2 [Rhizophagus irregularis]
METKMQNSIRYSTISTTMEISENVEVGKLIGRGGRNIKPIEKGTDNGNHQHTTSSNHKDNDLKEKRKGFKRRMPNATKARQSQNKKNIRRNVPVNQTNYNRST